MNGRTSGKTAQNFYKIESFQFLEDSILEFSKIQSLSRVDKLNTLREYFLSVEVSFENKKKLLEKLIEEGEVELYIEFSYQLLGVCFFYKNFNYIEKLSRVFSSYSKVNNTTLNVVILFLLYSEEVDILSDKIIELIKKFSNHVTSFDDLLIKKNDGFKEYFLYLLFYKDLEVQEYSLRNMLWLALDN